MKTIRERPCQRRHHRVTAPMNVQLEKGDLLQATNWSLGGIRLDGLKGQLPKKGTKLSMVLSLPFQGFDISFNVIAIVVRTVKKTMTIGCEFENLSERANDLMNHFIEDLVRGQMATIDDTICRIDVPVTPISTKPDPNPTSQTPIKRLPWKTIFMSTFYISFGILVFGYLMVLIYSNTMRMEVRSAVISAPLATLKMPYDGILRPVRFRLGQRVLQGEEIARIENPRLMSELENKRIELSTALRDQRRAEEKFRIESSRMKLYQVISRTDRQIAAARVHSSREALAAADTAYSRLSKLLKRKLVTANKFERAVKERAQAEMRLKEAEYDFERSTAMDSVSGRRYFNHKEFVADLDMYALEIEAANSAVKTAMMQLEKMEKLNGSLKILSPYDGRIVSIQQAANTTVLRNEPLLTIEQSIEPTVTAFLDQDQVLKVGLNDLAKVYLPSLGQHIDATVVLVDRNSTFINSKRSHYAWKDGKAKSAAVSLRLHIALAQRKDINAGLPAVVVFSKRQVNDIFHRVGLMFTKLIDGGNDDGSI